MKHLLFVTYLIGVLVDLDAGYFDSRYLPKFGSKPNTKGKYSTER